MMSTRRTAARFVVVGTIGFLVDWALLTVLSDAGLDLLLARAASFVAAVCVTFVLNRRFTFRASTATRGLPGLFAGYVLVQSLGAAVNFAVFLSLVQLRPPGQAGLLGPLAAASLSALLVTYSLSALLFRQKRTGPVCGITPAD